MSCIICLWLTLQLLRSESPSGMCAKLRTVAASNNREHMLRSLYYCLFAPHIYGVVLHTHSVRGEPHIQCNASREVATTSPVFNEPHIFCEGFTQHDLHILVKAPFCYDRNKFPRHFHCVQVWFCNLTFFCEPSVFLSWNLIVVLFHNNRVATCYMLPCPLFT